LKRFKKLDTYQAITALLVVGVIWLAVLFSVMIYNFSVVNKGVVINEELVKNITKANLKNTFKNADNIASMLRNLTEQDNKLDKLLNLTSHSK
jgi:TRAP-type uncharacterized transport system substrate-binding protein